MSEPWRWLGALAAVAVIMAVPCLRAASVTQNATMTATIGAVAKLTLSRATLSFPDADPDSTPAIAASGGPLSITAKARTGIGSTVTLSVQASGNLQSGLDSIPISRISWTATGTGFVNGTLSTAGAQAVGTWVSSGSWSGTQSYVLSNSWNDVAGTYSATLTYTLTAP